ncbi:unnamed protein product, partial [Iphiclides podalirius]
MSLQKSGYHIILLVTGCDEDKNKKKHLKVQLSILYLKCKGVSAPTEIHCIYTVTMTSPALKKSPEHQKISNKSPTRSTTERPQPTEPVASTSASTSEQPEAFSFLRIFKLADLMMKQGC